MSNSSEMTIQNVGGVPMCSQKREGLMHSRRPLKKGIPSACFCHLPILEKIFLAGRGADRDIKLESDFQDTNWPFYFGNKIKV